MARATVTHEINGKNYTFTQMNPRAAVPIGIRLSKIIIKPIGTGLSLFKDQFEDENDQKSLLDLQLDSKILDKLSPLIDKFIDGINEDETLDIFDKVLDTVIGGGTGDNGRMKMEDFTGDLKTMILVFAKAMEVNFGDFLSDAGGLLQKLKPSKE